MKNIVIYSSEHCPYCTWAKKLLQDKNLTFTEIRVDLDEKEREQMMSRSGRRTVPQIFIDDQHIGGYDDLCLFFKTNDR
jgi:glutaredoxin 3